MTSEEQYYSAKIFLSSYRDALNTLDQCAANKNQIARHHSLEQYLLLANKKSEVHIENGNIKQGTYFEESRIRKLGLFSKKIFGQNLFPLETAHTFTDVKKVLESYL